MDLTELRQAAWRNMTRQLNGLADSNTIWSNVLVMNEDQLSFAARASYADLAERARVEPSFGTKNLFWYHGK